MSLNGTGPVSAFAIYKKRSNASHNAKEKVNGVPPTKKIKKDLHEKKKQSTKSEKSKKIKLTDKKDKTKKLHLNRSAKQEKRTKKKKPLTIESSDVDEEQPPLLVPIERKKVVKENELGENQERKINRKKKKKISLDKSDILSNLNKTDPSPEGLKLFKWLIAPITPEQFFEKYWEQKTLFIERKADSYYSHILSTEKLDGIFREFPLYYTKNVDVVSYENGVKEVHNEEGRVVAAALYDYYSNGCSIRVLNPQTYDQKVHLLISTLQEYFGTMVGTNVYLTPPGSQGFAPHYDDIEAFIVQLEGRKHWKLYKPKGRDVLARDSSPNLTYTNIGDPFMEVTLNAGDLLYFPRGTIHEGKTDPDAHSLHITVSVYQHNSYADLLDHILPAALKKAADEDVEFRKGLPFNYLRHIGSVNRNHKSIQRSTVLDKVGKLMEKLSKYIDIDQAADQLGKKFMYDSMPPVLSKREVMHTSKYDGDFMKDGKVFNRAEIGMDTEVRLLRYHCLQLVVEEIPKIYYNTDNAKVYHGEEEQFLIVDEKLIPGIKKLQNTYPEFIEVESLPIEDNIAKAQLVSDLWERGLLVTNGPLPSFSGEESGDENVGSEDEIVNLSDSDVE